jgi:hypothetical protein
MICEHCEEQGHYWFSEDYAEYTPDDELPSWLGPYAYCDMRQVYQLSVGCECLCGHGKKKGNVKKDRRQINAEWTYTTRLGETYRFGRKGSGKNITIVTLAYLGKKEGVTCWFTS